MVGTGLQRFPSINGRGMNSHVNKSRSNIGESNESLHRARNKISISCHKHRQGHTRTKKSCWEGVNTTNGRVASGLSTSAQSKASGTSRLGRSNVSASCHGRLTPLSGLASWIKEYKDPDSGLNIGRAIVGMSARHTDGLT